jgi:hypothetical protein
MCHPYAAPMQRHLDVATFHIKPMSRRLVPTVVVGKVTDDDSKDAPHESAIPVVPVIAIDNF